MHLRYDMYSAPNKHPQQVMEELAITYQHATPQSIADQWWFWNCEGVTDTLPCFLSALDVDPMECIGWGLNLESAEAIRDKAEENNQ